MLLKILSLKTYLEIIEMDEAHLILNNYRSGNRDV